MKCKKCMWGTWLSDKKVVCMFPICLKEVKPSAKKTKEAMCSFQLPRVN